MDFWLLLYLFYKKRQEPLEEISRLCYDKARGEIMACCILCPRQCGADRTQSAGRCGEGADIRAARAALHVWEEPCVSGSRGSGTVFFSGCPLGCVFCQNREISRGGVGKTLTPGQLAQVFSRLEAQGAHNLNLVTPTHHTQGVLRALDLAKPAIPVVMNTGGYERVETLRLWEGYVQIYLPDLKYVSAQRSERYSGASDYFEAASRAILEMHRQQPRLEWEGETLRQGLVIRHLVMPGGLRDSLAALDFLDQALPKESFLLSLMSQYTPTPACAAFPEINRRVTTYEYQRVAQRAVQLGFSGYGQDRRSAREEYTPPFDLEGL